MKHVIHSSYLGRFCGMLQLNEVVAYVPVPFLRIARDKGDKYVN